jgi:hypothetical protein
MEFKFNIPVESIVIIILVGSVILAGIFQLPILGILGIFLPETRSTIPGSWAIGLLVALALFALIGLVWFVRSRRGK